MKEIYYSVEWKANPARQHLFGWGVFVYLSSDDVDLPNIICNNSQYKAIVSSLGVEKIFER
jgi:hypothetical protein